MKSYESLFFRTKIISLVNYRSGANDWGIFVHDHESFYLIFLLFFCNFFNGRLYIFPGYEFFFNLTYVAREIVIYNLLKLPVV